MAELAARIIGRKCSLPVVVLIHLDGERGEEMEAFPFRCEFVDYSLSSIHSKRKFCRPGCFDDDE